MSTRVRAHKLKTVAGQDVARRAHERELPEPQGPLDAAPATWRRTQRQRQRQRVAGSLADIVSDVGGVAARAVRRPGRPSVEVTPDPDFLSTLLEHPPGTPTPEGAAADERARAKFLAIVAAEKVAADTNPVEFAAKLQRAYFADGQVDVAAVLASHGMRVERAVVDARGHFIVWVPSRARHSWGLVEDLKAQGPERFEAVKGVNRFTDREIRARATRFLNVQPAGLESAMGAVA